MKRKVTIEDVAKHCHVSKSSVSRYLNHGYVSEDNKEKIQQAIEELGFERDFFARRIKAKHSDLIGIIAHDLTKIEQALILQGIQAHLHERGYQGVIQLSDGSAIKDQECLSTMIKQGVDGVIFVDCLDPSFVQAQVESSQMRVLFANRSCMFASFLDIDEEKAGSLLGNYCIEKNIHHVLYLGERDDGMTKRKTGMQKVYEVQGKQLTYSHHLAASPQDAYEAGIEVLRKQPELVICAKEEYGMAILKYLNEVHVHVPQNISVLAYGYGEKSKYSVPSLTVITCDYVAFGSNLAELLLAILEQGVPKWKDLHQCILERASVKNRIRSRLHDKTMFF